MRFLAILLSRVVLAIGVLVAWGGSAAAYSEFETAIEDASGRSINCAFCHEHPDGPEGVKPGQIDGLSPLEFKELNRARTAFEPGGAVDSPILNDFGDHLVNVIGKKKIVALRKAPLEIAPLLGESDLDHDGIADGEELLDGTHPLIHHHGAPSKLLVANFMAYWPHILMLLLATMLGIYGIENLLIWFGLQARSAFGAEDDED